MSGFVEPGTRTMMSGGDPGEPPADALVVPWYQQDCDATRNTRYRREVPDDTWTGTDWSALRAFQDRILNEVLRERDAQDAKFGQQNHPDGTSGHNFRKQADAARRACQEAARGGFLTWYHVAREEFFEAMAETDEDKLRAELVQNCAVFLAWIECIDRRKAARS